MVEPGGRFNGEIGVEERRVSEISQTARIRLIGDGAPAKPAPLVAPADAPAPRAAPAEAPARAPAAERPAAPIFLSDAADGADVLGAAAIVQPLAQLCVTGAAQTPFLAAIAGPAGAGKSFALKRLAQTVEKLAGTAGALGRVVVAHVEATGGAEAAVALASAAYSALDREQGVDYASLLDESAHAGGDPMRAAMAASDRHEEAVRRLEAERSQRDEAEARSARLPDALLFETPGSRVDVFARSRRGAIDASLRRFDLAGTDAGASYRDLVRDVASMGAGGRIGVALRAVWAYSGQRRLLFWAIVAFALGFGVHLMHGSQAMDAVQVPTAAGEMVTNSTLKATDWIRTHGSWFETAAKILYALGALALALNLWRAVGFATLVMRGAQLLNLDVRDRRRDLDDRVARLSQRVAALSAAADTAARRAEAAAHRVRGKAQTRAPGPDFLDARHGDTAAALGFLAALGERIAAGPSQGAPERLVFVVDNLDALPPAAAIAWIDAARGAIGPGAVGVLALDPARLVGALGGPTEARRRLDKWLQAVVNLPGRAAVSGERLIARLLAPDVEPAAPAPDPAVAKALTEPLSSAETTLLAALAPLAADSARAAKRFLNAYRLARCSNASRSAIALMLAVAFADEEIQSAMRRRLSNGGGDLEPFDGPERLVSAVRSARAANIGALTVADARAADAVARRYAPSV
ncbi:hypothetical protein DFR50_13717 [Roseiarcus fermentans]|uniref:KAP-like P-loop domain-containing protein n=1 Tax=Roseiarcus fermentans TaxID=1473586 RepID=A0A366ERH8_9HYPH|nr:hypothetical protein [Roseiarcus fermentans]RBP05032.1 hypothetical protein DFR50_13717 [Roseiarcus fermentans]